MTIIITSTLMKWLTDHSLQGFIRVAEAPPQPNALEMASKLSIDTLTNSMVQKKLGFVGRLWRPSRQRAERAERTEVADKPSGKGWKKAWDWSA